FVCLLWAEASVAAITEFTAQCATIAAGIGPLRTHSSAFNTRVVNAVHDSPSGGVTPNQSSLFRFASAGSSRCTSSQHLPSQAPKEISASSSSTITSEDERRNAAVPRARRKGLL